MAKLRIAAIIAERLEKLPGFRVKHCHSCGEKIFAVGVDGKSVAVDYELESHRENCEGGRKHE